MLILARMSLTVCCLNVSEMTALVPTFWKMVLTLILDYISQVKWSQMKMVSFMMIKS